MEVFATRQIKNFVPILEDFSRIVEAYVQITNTALHPGHMLAFGITGTPRPRPDPLWDREVSAVRQFTFETESHQIQHLVKKATAYVDRNEEVALLILAHDELAR